MSPELGLSLQQQQQQQQPPFSEIRIQGLHLALPFPGGIRLREVFFHCKLRLLFLEAGLKLSKLKFCFSILCLGSRKGHSSAQSRESFRASIHFKSEALEFPVLTDC